MRLFLASLALLVPAAPAVARPTAVGVGEREWRIALYRPSVPVGMVKFNVRNFGEDGHDFVVLNSKGAVRARLPELRAGDTASVTTRLRRPGRFTVICSIAGHEALGMRAILRVKRRRML